MSLFTHYLSVFHILRTTSVFNVITWKFVIMSLKGTWANVQIFNDLPLLEVPVAKENDVEMYSHCLSGFFSVLKLHKSRARQSFKIRNFCLNFSISIILGLLDSGFQELCIKRIKSFFSKGDKWLIPWWRVTNSSAHAITRFADLHAKLLEV